ncbi:acyltransferase [Hyphomonas oceanitis]|uniref:acyltransferase family protein n=1 Tax=Hyphomonas oceanitis TaxID=81033 RepID=UPI0030030F33
MLHGLQILRAVAAYGVVAFHVFEFLNATPGFGLSRFEIGKVGVDLFFVISGFIMVHTTARSEKPGHFIIKRAARIIPLYWAATALAILATLSTPWLFPHADLSPASMLKSFAFIPAPDLSGEFQPILFVGWTLNFEMMFYGLFALSLFLPAHYRIRALVAALVAVFILGRLSGADTSAAFYGQPIMLDFGIGCLIARAVSFPRITQMVTRAPLWPIAATVLAGLVTVNAAGLSQDAAALLNGLLSGLLIFAVAAHDLHRKPAHSPLLTSLGDTSYSAYLLHPFLIPVCGVICVKLFGTTLFSAGLMLAACFIGTAMIASLSYYTYERPSNRLLRRFLLPRRIPPNAAQ